MIETLHNVQSPAGPQAAVLFDLWQVMLGVCGVVLVVVLASVIWALWRAPRATEATAPDLDMHPIRESKVRRVIGYAVIASTALLLGLLAESFVTDRAIAGLPLADAVRIDLIGHQYWWEAVYDSGDPSLAFATANELHVPVGRPVVLTLRSDDVIHSFWVPSLHGKKDLIPGRESVYAFRADRVGVYRGQCAEFCGYQHAHMTLLVFAEEPGAYEQWVSAQRRPAMAPSGDLEHRGFELVVRTSCAMCHAIGGTKAQGRKAPDLTHFASRSTLGAGSFANDSESLTRWIADPQRLKPGVNMPPNEFAPEDLTAIAAYLTSLK